MSKLSNMLSMLFILQKGGIHPISELATILEVGNRQIRRYRDALEMAGIYVQSSPGKNGGYYIDDDSNMDIFKAQTSKDLMLFSKIFENNMDLSLQELNDIHKTVGHQLIEDDGLLSQYPLQHIRHFMLVHYAIQKHRVVEIEYFTRSKHVIERRIQPYFVFRKHRQDYLAAYSPDKKSIIYMRISRMHHVRLTHKTFEIDTKQFQKNKRIVETNQGVFFDGTFTEVDIRCDDQVLGLIKELFNDKAIVRKTYDGSYEVTLKVGRIQEIKHILLSLGSQVQVTHPVSLRDEMKLELKKALSRYE